jgi:hypothetical protein
MNSGEDSTGAIGSGPFGHSKASSRYESGVVKTWGEYDRNRFLLEWVGVGKRVLGLDVRRDICRGSWRKEAVA